MIDNVRYRPGGIDSSACLFGGIEVAPFNNHGDITTLLILVFSNQLIKRIHSNRCDQNSPVALVVCQIILTFYLWPHTQEVHLSSLSDGSSTT